MRLFSHWSPRYIRDRVMEMLYQKAFPDHPWMTKDANKILDSLLRPDDVGLEFGSGRSTLWFARRVRHLISIERNPVWYGKINEKLQSQGIGNVKYIYNVQDNDESKRSPVAYAAIFDEIQDSSLDFVLIDGLFRGLCAGHAIRCVKPGGMIIIDNVNWYLPSDSRAPRSLKSNAAPTSDWTDFYETTNTWRRIWTTSGVTDTAIYFKPCP